MTQKQIKLDFGAFVLDAELFDTAVAKKFAAHLPYTIRLTQWGEELYGPVGIDLGEENPVPDIPPGGIAYSRRGNYVCIFFGQTPAWPVEHIGRIPGDSWDKLLENPDLDGVTIRRP
ncbi:MAG: cyclophilin-like fold protein [Thermodesulfobacteriota bacterium]